MVAGRNDPCPCGSGKKFKKCCLPAEAPAVSVPQDLTPAQLVLARARAFREGDFGFIYDSYHPDSNFIGQFPERQAYLRYGEQTLNTDFEIRECRILLEEVSGEEARVIFYLDTLFRGERVESLELSFFLLTTQGWRYHSSQKTTREECPGPLEEIDWSDFDRVKDKVLF